MSAILELEPLDVAETIYMEDVETSPVVMCEGEEESAVVESKTLDLKLVNEEQCKVPLDLVTRGDPPLPTYQESINIDRPSQETVEPGSQADPESSLEGLVHYPDIVTAVSNHQKETTALRKELDVLLDRETELLQSLNDIQQKIVDTETDLKRKQDSLSLSVQLLQGSVTDISEAREQAKKLMNPFVVQECLDKDEGVEMSQVDPLLASHLGDRLSRNASFSQYPPSVGLKRSASFSSEGTRKRSRDGVDEYDPNDATRSRRGSMSYLPTESCTRRAQLLQSAYPYYEKSSPTHHHNLQSSRAYKPRSTFSRPPLSSKPSTDGKSSGTKPNYMPRFAEGDVNMLLEKIDQGVIPACLFDKANLSDIPFLDWSKTPPPSFLYVIAMFYEGQEGVERGISSFCKKQNIAKKGLVYLVQRIYEFCNPTRFASANNVNPGALPKIKNAMETLRRVVSREEIKWKKAKDHFGWTLRSLESWPSYDWPSNAKAYFNEVEKGNTE